MCTSGEVLEKSSNLVEPGGLQNNMNCYCASFSIILEKPVPSTHPHRKHTLKYVLTNIHQAETIEQMEKLLPYNIDPHLLNDMPTIPELIMPEKDGG